MGMVEALGNLDKIGSAITINNTDTYKYSDPRLNMNVSIPFYTGIHHSRHMAFFRTIVIKAFLISTHQRRVLLMLI